MIRYFLAKGDWAGSAMIIEGLPDCTCSNPPPRVEIATLYMKTYCTACKREGFIAPRGPRWPGTASNGKQWALSGDINVCGCNPPPVFHAERGMTMSFTAEQATALIAPYTRSGGGAESASKTKEARHTSWFFVWDSVTGEPVVNRDFVADVGGVRRSGKTDGDGYARIATDGEQAVNIHVIFSSPKRDLNPLEGT